MFNKLILSIALIIAIVFPIPGNTQSLNEAGAFFLNIPPGSRANAMGGAHTAVADDFYALYFNPAGITRLQKGSIGFFHHNFGFVGLPIIFGGAAYRTRFGTVGFAFSNFDINTRGPFNEDLNSYERAFQFSYANQLSNHFAVGGTVKLVQVKFDQPEGFTDVSADAWVFDIGFLVQNLFPHLTYTRHHDAFPERFRKFHRDRFRGLSFGLALLNTGPDKLVFVDESQGDPLPQILRLGLAFKCDGDR